ncbi:MAG: cupin domain-containing protein [Bdellovibrionales bacterium]|nr:cupin domain-containing protein [Bdellovibrionales bacterium]
MKPIVNLNEVELQRHKQGSFSGGYGILSDLIGAKKLGYNVTTCDPGAKVCPFHNHHQTEEMFLILEGKGTLRFGNQEYAIGPMDVIACPPGGPEVAHQILNTGQGPLRYLSVSTRDEVDVCEYPDSNKLGVYAGKAGDRRLRKLFQSESEVDYWKGEE